MLQSGEMLIICKRFFRDLALQCGTVGPQKVTRLVGALAEAFEDRHDLAAS